MKACELARCLLDVNGDTQVTISMKVGNKTIHVKIEGVISNNEGVLICSSDDATI